MIRLQLTASEEKRRADLAHHAMLRAQLDPHMLFNTLANLRALIGQDTEQALTMLDQLDSFLRHTLKSSRAPSHTLAHELKVLDSYLALMKIRMAERLTYSFSIDDDCNNMQIPGLLLQPLVENAIRHGLEPLVEGGHINIEARLKSNHLTLIVEDNGVGMQSNSGEEYSLLDENRNPPVRQSIEIDESGFGLENLRKRLQQTFHSNASLTFEPFVADGKSTSGTRVTIQLPALVE